MSEITNDARLEAQLRSVMSEEVANLPVRVTPAQVLERRDARNGAGASWRRRIFGQPNSGLMRVAMTVGVVAVLAVGAALAFSFFNNRPAFVGPAASATPEEQPTASPMTTGSSWPQSTTAEIKNAQQRADAGDTEYTWQIDARLLDGPDGISWQAVWDGRVEIIDRFLRDQLGWDKYIHNNFEGGIDHSLIDQRFLRCAAGITNPLYPPQPGSEMPGESCAPTIDDLTYESVSFDLIQPDRKGARGIWVVSNWQPITFTQADPAVAEAQASTRLTKFLDARIAGEGAENIIQVYGDWIGHGVPLLYATTSGSRYERYEFEKVDDGMWPYDGYIGFQVRLFADDGATVVEQRIESQWDGGLTFGLEGGLELNAVTTENGQLVPMLHEQLDGEVTYLSPYPNSFQIGEDASGFMDFTDPSDRWSECGQGQLPTDAAAFAQAVTADSNLETTEPAAALIGGIEGVAMDVALAPGGEVCAPVHTDTHQWIRSLEPGKRMRLYLLDLPGGLSMRTLAITVMADEGDFEDVIDKAQPIIDSMEFHPS